MTKDEAIDHFGTKSKLARALNINRQAVQKWNRIPALRQLQIQIITHGELKANREDVL